MFSAKEKIYFFILIVFCLWRAACILSEDLYNNSFTRYYKNHISNFLCVVNQLPIKKDSVVHDKINVTAIGDSLTLGSWLLRKGESYPDILQEYLGDSYNVINNGVSSETSFQAASREGGIFLLVKNETAEKWISKISFAKGEEIHSRDACYLLKGSIGNKYGVLLSNDIFIPYKKTKGGAASKYDSFTIDTGDLYKEVVVIWIGVNDKPKDDLTLKNIEAIVSSLQTEKFLVLSIMNRATEDKNTMEYKNIKKLNKRLSETYKERYVDIRSILVGSYDRSSAADTLDFSSDVLPLSLRLDSIHLNKKGNEIVAKTVGDAILNTLNKK